MEVIINGNKLHVGNALVLIDLVTNEPMPTVLVMRGKVEPAAGSQLPKLLPDLLPGMPGGDAPISR